MSAKLKRSDTATPRPHRGKSSIPQASGGNAGCAASPLSPTRHSRLQEKAELRNLNDRLACYIDRVRNLETENARLSLAVQDSRDNISREVTHIKAMYENELTEARRLLDDTAREKAKLEIDTKRLWEENEEVKAKLKKKAKDYLVSEENARLHESRIADLSTKVSAANADRTKAVEELNELQIELKRVCKQLDESRKHLEDETLARVDLENSIQSLREELTFKEQVHSKEVSENRSRRLIEISEIDGRLCEQYEAKLAKSLQELRDQYESQMRVNRDEIELLYESKIKNLESAANRNSSLVVNSSEQLRATISRIEFLNERIENLESTNSNLNTRIRELEQLLDQERERSKSEIIILEDELKRARNEMSTQLQEYQDLMDIKVSLDLEIAAYDKLLCGEEKRLNITPPSANTDTAFSLSQTLCSSRVTPSRRSHGQLNARGASKRKRTVNGDDSDICGIDDILQTDSAEGDMQIIEIDSAGRFVKIANNGSKQVDICGWQLKRTTENKEIIFKFDSTTNIKAGATVTVWSSDIGVTNESPHTIVMKDQQWFIGDYMKTILLNDDMVEVAISERSKQAVSKRLTRKPKDKGRVKKLSIDVFDNEDPHRGQERCRVM